MKNSGKGKSRSSSTARKKTKAMRRPLKQPPGFSSRRPEGIDEEEMWTGIRWNFGP